MQNIPHTGFYAVDTFLFIGGFVVVLSNLSSIRRAKGPLEQVFYTAGYLPLKRYSRIMPAYAMTVFLVYYILR